VREGSRRDTSVFSPNKDGGKGINPELLVAIYEAVAAAQLVISGKFDDKVVELKQARDALEEKLGLIKVVTDAQNEAEKITSEANKVLAAATSTLEKAKQEMERANSRHTAATEQASANTTSEESLSTKWAELRKERLLFENDRENKEQDLKTRLDSCVARESNVRGREVKVTEGEQRLKRKLEVLATTQ